MPADEFIFVRCSSMHAEDENDDDSNIHTRASFAFENADDDDEDVVVANTAGVLESQGRKIFRTFNAKRQTQWKWITCFGKKFVDSRVGSWEVESRGFHFHLSLPAAAVPNSSVILHLTDAAKSQVI